MQFFAIKMHEKSRNCLKVFKRAKICTFLMLRLQCHAEICIMAARYGEMGEWLKPRPC